MRTSTTAPSHTSAPGDGAAPPVPFPYHHRRTEEHRSSPAPSPRPSLWSGGGEVAVLLSRRAVVNCATSSSSFGISTSTNNGAARPPLRFKSPGVGAIGTFWNADAACFDVDSTVIVDQ